MKRTFILIGSCVLLIGMPKAHGQFIGNSTGGTKTIGVAEYDWSIGEVALVNTFYGPTDKNIVVTQGMLQNEESTPVKVAATPFTRNLLVFPNPATSIVNLQFNSAANGVLTYRLLDMTGKVIMQHSADVKQGMFMEQINISDLAVATYMLAVALNDNGTTSDAATTYKIDKLK